MIDHLEYDQILNFADRYALGFEKGKDSRHFLRVMIPNGMITAEQFRKIGKISEKFCRNYAEITTRQDIQMHWIDGENAIDAFEVLEELGFTTDKCGQARPIAHYGDVRNIVGCPLTGIDPKEILDCSPFVRELKKFISGNRAFMDLPRKFKISISGCPINCTSPEIQDIGLVAVRNNSGEIGFIALLGGGTGVPARIGVPLGLFIPRDECVDVIIALLEIFRDYGKRDSKARSRFKFLVDEWGIEKIRDNLRNKFGTRLEVFDQKPLDASGNEHIGINSQKQEGYYYVNFPIQNGELTDNQMFAIADIAEKYGWPEIRLTPFQNLILVGIRKENLTGLILEMEKIGFGIRKAPFQWMSLSCRQDFCTLAVTNDSVSARTREIVEYLEKKFSPGLGNLDIKISVSGCPSACSRYPVADIGLQAALYHENGIAHAGYNVYIGGGLGRNPSFGRLVRRAVDKDKINTSLEKLISSYIRERTPAENFRDFYGKKTIEELSKLLEV